jgi:hypothetical protein
MHMISRRRFVASGSALLASGVAIPGCSPNRDTNGYDAVAARTWRLGLLEGQSGAALGQELVRYATLAPSSHNTQCWNFSVGDTDVSIRPDLTRRCPAVDPDDHHLFVSLGCATENLLHGALAHGFHGDANLGAHDVVRVTLERTAAQSSTLFTAIPERQCTRGDFDARPVSNAELNLLQRAAAVDGVRVLLLTERRAMDRLLEQVVHANTAQMADAAFVKELRSWIRFNGAAAVRTRDGLYSGCTGNPTVPTWIGELAFGLFYTPKSENDKIIRQIRSSAGIAIFVGAAADKTHWIDVGRSYQRFALQATALGIRNSFLNQPVEVVPGRAGFAAAVGIPGQRPDLVVRFGRGAAMPRSLRRPVSEVLV